MTYKHKLARRLAISRECSMVSVLLLLTACAGETTGPDAAATPGSAEAVAVIPSKITIETNQRIRFRSGPHGREYASPLVWKSSGGTITSDGVFYASEPGTYKVVVGRGRGRHKGDTSTVVVVPSSDLTDIAIVPDSASLLAGESRTFSASGRLSDGSTTVVAVTWTATGGSIDSSGVYKAGSVAGRYRVIGTNSSGTLADTANVTITVPPAEVVLKPVSVSLTSGQSKQFSAYGLTSIGDSIALKVTYTATGGTITSSGLYTAGSTAGTFRVVAAASGLADTATVTLTQPTTSTGRTGIPFGPSQQLARTGAVTSPFTMSMDAYSPSNIVTRISAARAGGYTLLLALPGGSHSLYMSTIDGVYQFDGKKWRAAMDAYNTSTIRQAVAGAVADGVVLAANIMDEPYVFGGSSGGGNTWGPKGTMTKARVDSLCGYVKAIFPTLAAGPEHQHHLFEPDKSYRVCDFYIDQYKAAYGSATTYRDAALQMAARDGHAVMFALNILDGGVQDRDGTWDCTGAGQGGLGTYSPNCRMTAAQVRDWGTLFGTAGCGGLYMWRYDNAFVANTANQQAFSDLKGKLSTLPVRSCLRK